MTRHKRTHNAPRKEQPSEAPPPSEFETPPGESPQNDQGEPESAPVPSFSADEPAGFAANAEPEGESEFYFPPLHSDAIGFTPLPARLGGDQPIRLPGARRRRRQNWLVTRLNGSELSQRLESAVRRAAPTFDFFLFSLLAGVILGVGYLFDAQAVLLLGILVAPVLAPWVGAALAAAIGEIRFLGQTLGGFCTALLMIFVTGVLAGFISRLMPMTATQALAHARLLPFDLLLVALGAIVLTVAFIKSEEKPLLASLMVAYGIYLPLSAAGFGLGSGVENLWPQALLVFLTHLALSMLLALLVFYYLGFRPFETYSYALTGLLVLVSLATIFAAFTWGNNVRGQPLPATPFPPTNTPTSAVAIISQPTVTLTPEPQPSPTRVALATPTTGVTPSPTLLPTPMYGRVGNNGAYIRNEPGGAAITTLESGYLVEFLPDTPMILEGTTWVRVRVKTSLREIVGWVLLNLIVTSTPAPSLTP